MAGMAENTKYRAFTHVKQQHYTVSSQKPKINKH